MSGFITERDFATAECEFPGIQRLYESDAYPLPRRKA